MAEREAAKAAEETRHIKEQEEQAKGRDGGVSQSPRKDPRTAYAAAHAARRAGGRARPERGAGLPFSQYDVQRSRPPDQQLRARWGIDLGRPPEAGYEFWRDQLQPLGFDLKAEVLEYPGGMPGDIGFFLTWK